MFFEHIPKVPGRIGNYEFARDNGCYLRLEIHIQNNVFVKKDGIGKPF